MTIKNSSVALPYQPKRIYATTSLTGTKLNTRYSSSPRPCKAQGQNTRESGPAQPTFKRRCAGRPRWRAAPANAPPCSTTSTRDEAAAAPAAGLGHVRKPFIPVVAQEYDVLQELAKAHRKREPCGEALGFQSRGLQNLTKRHARQQRIGRLPNTGKAKKTPTPNPHRSAISGTNSRSKARLSGSTYDSAPGT